MSGETIWNILGLDQTAERDQIRRAYARRLRVVNPEDDAAGFQRLRDAYDRALSWADSGPPPPSRGPELSPGSIKRPLPPLTAPDFGDPNSGSSQWGRRDDTPEDKTHRQALQTLRALVLDGDAADRDQLAALEAVLASPALERIAVHDDMAGALAALIVEAAPRADGLAERVIDYFGWDNATRDASFPLKDEVLRRRDDLRMVQQLKNNRRSLQHAAFKSLSAEPTRIRRGSNHIVIDPALVKGFLAFIEQERPTLFYYLNPNSVSWWRDYLSRTQVNYRYKVASIVLSLFLGFFLPMRLIGEEGGWLTLSLAIASTLFIGVVGSVALILAGHFFIRARQKHGLFRRG